MNPEEFSNAVEAIYGHHVKSRPIALLFALLVAEADEHESDSGGNIFTFGGDVVTIDRARLVEITKAIYGSTPERCTEVLANDMEALEEVIQFKLAPPAEIMEAIGVAPADDDCLVRCGRVVEFALIVDKKTSTIQSLSARLHAAFRIFL